MLGHKLLDSGRGTFGPLKDQLVRIITSLFFSKSGFFFFRDQLFFLFLRLSWFTEIPDEAAENTSDADKELKGKNGKTAVIEVLDPDLEFAEQKEDLKFGEGVGL